MKKALAILWILAICLLAWQVYAGNVATQGLCVSEDICDTESQTCTAATSSSNQALSSSSTNVWKASKFQASETHTRCSTKLNVRKVGSPSFNVLVAIYTDNSGDPGTIVGSWSDAVAGSTFSTTPTYTYVEFPNMSASLTATTEYWLVVKASATGDESNYIDVKATSDCDYEEGIDYSADGISWTVQNMGVGFQYYGYK